VNIAFANELSMICDRENIDVWELISLANRHPRVDILQPGPGVGGHCIAVDPWFIIDRAPEESKLIKQARLTNDSKPDWVISKIIEKASKFKSPTISILGLAFKANVDDLRESPSVEITKKLLTLGLGNILVCEPNIKEHAEFTLSSFDNAVEKADILVVLVDHKEFMLLSAAKLSEKIIIDTRGIIK
jgi:UDP-N-acetyl-D-mannosaminuronic acid dehydrogenase